MLVLVLLVVWLAALAAAQPRRQACTCPAGAAACTLRDLVPCEDCCEIVQDCRQDPVSPFPRFSMSLFYAMLLEMRIEMSTLCC
jgi:hypothetical protein